jgi:hypothetical protein
MQPDPGEAGDEHRVGGNDAQISGEGQVEPGSDRGAVDRCKRRDAQLPEAAERCVKVVETFIDLIGPSTPQRVEDARVGARAERRAGAGDDRRADRGVLVDLFADGAKLSRRGGVEGIARLGAVEGDPRSAVRDGQLDPGPTH